MTIPSISTRAAVSAAIVALVVVALCLGIWWLVRRPQPAPLLSPAAEAAVRDGIQHSQASAGRDTTRAKAAAASATPNYAAGSAYAGVATILHQQSKPHAKPTPSDTAAERLQWQLSSY